SLLVAVRGAIDRLEDRRHREHDSAVPRYARRAHDGEEDQHIDRQPDKPAARPKLRRQIVEGRRHLIGEQQKLTEVDAVRSGVDEAHQKTAGENGVPSERQEKAPSLDEEDEDDEDEHADPEIGIALVLKGRRLREATITVAEERTFAGNEERREIPRRNAEP